MSLLWQDDNTTIDSYDINDGTDGLMDNFDPTDSYGDDIIGDPAESMQDWHQQADDKTCAVVAQEFVLDELTGQDFTEGQLRQEAAEHGWYTDEGGTPINDVGNLLEEHGIEVERSTGNTLDDLAEKLANGDKIIVGVNGEEIWNNVGDDTTNDFTGSFAGVTQQGADHAVEVIGIDNTNPDDPIVILNDPGHPDGMGMEVPADQFMEAWNDSNDFMVNTTGNVEDSADLNNLGFVDLNSQVDDSSEPSLGGFYNNDGTYHWSSDNTNTDEDGNVVYYGIK